MQLEIIFAWTPKRLADAWTAGTLSGIVIALFSALLVMVGASPSLANYDQLSVTYYNVGPGNCVLIQCPSAEGTNYVNLMIDCGSHATTYRGGVVQMSALSVLDYATGEEEEGVEIVNNLILTHPDKDHYNLIYGLRPLLKFAEVDGNDNPVLNESGTLVMHEPNMGTVYSGGVFKQYEKDGSLWQWIQRSAKGDIHGQASLYQEAGIVEGSSNKSERLKGGHRLPIVNKAVQALHVDSTVKPRKLPLCGDAEVFLLAANSNRANISTLTNAQSLVIALKYKKRVFIFPGDATNKSAQGNALQAALDSWARQHEKTLSSYDTYDSALKVDFMMAPHHGSNVDGSDWNGWAEVTHPDYVIFSANPNIMDFNHPKTSAFEAYRPHLKSTREPIPFTHFTPTGLPREEPTRHDVTISEAAILLAETGDFIVNVNSDGEVSINCSGNQETGWGCGTDLFEAVAPEDDASVHRRLIADSATEDESFEGASAAAGAVPTGWELCGAGGVAHEGAVSAQTPWGAQMLYLEDDGAAMTARGTLGFLSAGHTYHVSADFLAKGSYGSFDYVDVQLVALDLDSSSDACVSYEVLDDTTATLIHGAGWETARLEFSVDSLHPELSKDIALLLKRSNAQPGELTVYADNVKVVETRGLAESFESPLVNGYEQGALPAAGWVDCLDSDGVGLASQGAGAAFEATHGLQVLELNGLYAGITSQQGTIGTFTEGHTYTVSFEAKSNSEESAEYWVELVAFSGAEDDDDRRNCGGGSPGTVLKSSNGWVYGGRDWKSRTFNYTPVAGAPELSQEIGLRIVSLADDPILYDDVSLTVSGPADLGGIILVAEDSASIGGFTTSYTLADHFVPGVVDKVIVTVSGERDRIDANTAIESVTYGGVQMTEVIQVKNYDEGPVAIYYLDNPPTSGAIEVSTNGKFNGVHGSWMAAIGTEDGVGLSGHSRYGSFLMPGAGLAVVAFHSNASTSAPAVGAPMIKLLSVDGSYSAGAAGCDVKGSGSLRYRFSGDGADPIVAGALFR